MHVALIALQLNSTMPGIIINNGSFVCCIWKALASCIHCHKRLERWSVRTSHVAVLALHSTDAGPTGGLFHGTSDFRLHSNCQRAHAHPHTLLRANLHHLTSSASHILPTLRSFSGMCPRVPVCAMTRHTHCIPFYFAFEEFYSNNNIAQSQSFPRASSSCASSISCCSISQSRSGARKHADIRSSV